MPTLACRIDLTLGSFRLKLDEKIALEGITALFGASGSGKTTLLRVIAGLETRGNVQLSVGPEVWQDAETTIAAHRRGVGYVFQDGALFEHLSVAGNLRFPLRFGPERGRLSLDEVTAALDLSSLLDRRPATLSGGERQRVAIARAVLGAHRLLLMDEPVSALDIDRRRGILGMIESLPERFGIPVIYVTHDAGEMMRLADRALLIEAGQIVVADEVRRVAHHAAFEGKSLVRDAGSLLDVTVASHTPDMTSLSVDGQTIRVPRIATQPGTRARVRVPARDVVIALEKPAGLSIRNTLETVVTTVTDRGRGLCDVVLSLGEQDMVARVTRDAVEELELREGRQVFALVKSVAVEDDLGQ